VQNSDFIAIQAETIGQLCVSNPRAIRFRWRNFWVKKTVFPLRLRVVLAGCQRLVRALGREETTFLSEQSDGKNPTQQSPSSVSAKSSGGRPVNSAGNQPKKSTSSQSS
jgi:hypothetical protein